mgnify:CR=1 FL=1
MLPLVQRKRRPAKNLQLVLLEAVEKGVVQPWAVPANRRNPLLKHRDAAVAGIRRTGSASTDLAWLAAGRFDGYWEAGLKPWDVAAGQLLLREAGGEDAATMLYGAWYHQEAEQTRFYPSAAALGAAAAQDYLRALRRGP